MPGLVPQLLGYQVLAAQPTCCRAPCHCSLIPQGKPLWASPPGLPNPPPVLGGSPGSRSTLCCRSPALPLSVGLSRTRDVPLHKGRAGDSPCSAAPVTYRGIPPCPSAPSPVHTGPGPVSCSCARERAGKAGREEGFSLDFLSSPRKPCRAEWRQKAVKLVIQGTQRWRWRQEVARSGGLGRRTGGARAVWCVLHREAMLCRGRCKSGVK